MLNIEGWFLGGVNCLLDSLNIEFLIYKFGFLF